MTTKPHYAEEVIITGDSLMEDFVKRYLFLLKPDKTYEYGMLLIATILDILYYEGRSCRMGFNAFCKELSRYYCVDCAVPERAFADFRTFFLNEADKKMVNAVLRYWQGNWDSLTDYQILQASAAYVMYMMRKYGYSNDVDSRYKSVAFTGPRPEKLPRALDRPLLQQAIMNMVLSDISKGFEIFYSGMSRGVDMIVADCILQAQESHPHIQLRCALPFPQQANLWSSAEQEEYRAILARADKINNTAKYAFKQAYLVRSEFMIRNSARLRAVYDGKSGGGTKYAVEYAQQSLVQTMALNPAKLIEQ